MLFCLLMVSLRLLRSRILQNFKKWGFFYSSFPNIPCGFFFQEEKYRRVSTLNEFYTWAMNTVGWCADFFSSFTCNNDRGLHFHRKVGTHLWKLTNLARILLTYISTHNFSIYLRLYNDYGECCIFFSLHWGNFLDVAV